MSFNQMFSREMFSQAEEAPAEVRANGLIGGRGPQAQNVTVLRRW